MYGILNKKIPAIAKQLKIEKTPIKEDAGYRVLLGAFNTYNIKGEFYRLDDPDRLLNDKTLLADRYKNGLLKSEWDHPDVSGLPPEAARERYLYIDPNRTCNQITKVEFFTTNIKEEGWDLPIILVIGWVVPIPVFGDKLEQLLKDPNINVAYSVRVINLKPKLINGIKVKDVLDVITWDYVSEPGVYTSTQWMAGGLKPRSNEVSSEGLCIDGRCPLTRSKSSVSTESVLNTDDSNETIKKYKEIIDRELRKRGSAFSEWVI